MATNAKILVVGPSGCGKSTICNYLADFSEIIGGEYIPTVGCRILELEQEFKINNRNVKCEVELWDVSGDQKYQACWPAIADESSGIVFVYNPNNQSHVSDINVWYNTFVENGSLNDDQCLVIAHKNPNTEGKADAKLSNLFTQIPKINSNIEEEGETLREEFKQYLNKIYNNLIKRRDQEESRILK